jgi:hypothetical protein
MSKLPLTVFLPSVIPPWQATQFWRNAAVSSANTAEVVKAKMEMNVKNFNIKTSQPDKQ